MSLSVKCSCGHSYFVHERFAGQERKCLYCGATYVVPGTSALASDELQLQPSAESKPAPARPQQLYKPPIPAAATTEDLAARAAAVRESYGAPPLRDRPLR